MRLLKLIFGVALLFVILFGKAMADSPAPEGQPPHKFCDLTLSVPYDFTATGDAAAIYGPYPGVWDNPDNWTLQASLDFYLSPMDELGVCYQHNHKWVNGGPNYDATIGATENSFLVMLIRQVIGTGSWDVQLSAGAGLCLMDGFESDLGLVEDSIYDDPINGIGFSGKAGLGIYYHLTGSFSLGVEGGYQYETIPLHLQIPSLYVKTSGTQALDANGGDANVDFSGWYINFISVRFTFFQFESNGNGNPESNQR